MAAAPARLRRLSDQLQPPELAPAAGGGDGSGRARIALIGPGWWALGWHLPQLHSNPRVSLVAIVDTNTELLGELRAKYAGCETFGTLAELLATK
eukprot:SAG31_NODE_28070_length_416_cov_0.567823_1_plen_94_part_10